MGGLSIIPGYPGAFLGGGCMVVWSYVSRYLLGSRTHGYISDGGSVNGVRRCCGQESREVSAWYSVEQELHVVLGKIYVFDSRLIGIHDRYYNSP